MVDVAAIIARLKRDLALLDATVAGNEARQDLAIPSDLIEVDAAAEIAGLRPDTIRLWARKHPFTAEGGFGLKFGGRIKVSRRRFVEYLRKK